MWAVGGRDNSIELAGRFAKDIGGRDGAKGTAVGTGSRIIAQKNELTVWFDGRHPFDYLYPFAVGAEGNDYVTGLGWDLMVGAWIKKDLVTWL
jgi:hypothetical protein